MPNRINNIIRLKEFVFRLWKPVACLNCLECDTVHDKILEESFQKFSKYFQVIHCTIPTLLMLPGAIRCQTRPQCLFLTKISTNDQKVGFFVLLTSVVAFVVGIFCQHALLSEFINTPAGNPHLSSTVMMMMSEDYTIAITPFYQSEEPVNSLIMENEHLDTISATESDEFIKYSVDIPMSKHNRASKGVPIVCDVPFHDNSLPLDFSKDQSEGFL
ncbi:hypothetical protein Tco_1326803 [Tanacetum coccineum]